MSKRAPKWQDLLGLDLELKLMPVPSTRTRSTPLHLTNELKESAADAKRPEITIVIGPKGTVH